MKWRDSFIMPGNKKPATGSAFAPLTEPSSRPAMTPPRINRAIPATSIARAKAAFKNFSLSKFAGTEFPANYVASGQSVAAVQQQVIQQHVEKLNQQDVPTRSLTVALPPSAIKKLFPSLNQHGGTIDLGEVLTVVEQNTRGTEFYAHGNPTLNRLSIEARVQQMINSVKQGGDK